MSVEALLVGRLDGTQIKPSAMIAGREGVVEELGDAARVLDGKLGRTLEVGSLGKLLHGH